MSDSIALINACSRGNVEEVERILQTGVNVNQGDYDKRTPMHLAASEGKEEIIRLLLSHSADVNVVDRWGNTPLDDALKFHQDGVADLLTSVGAIRSKGKDDDDGEEGSLSIVKAYLNLASDRLGANVIWANDEWFASAENLIKPGRGVMKPGVFTDRGQWMDGWESARHGSLKRGGKDTAYIKLGTTGVIRGVDIDTNNFTGNHGEFASIDALYIKANISIADLQSHSGWKEILPKTKLNPGSQHIIPIRGMTEKFNYVRLHMYPDGGIARLKVYGEVIPDWSIFRDTDRVDLIAAVNGGKVVSVSDNYFSSQDNVLMPGRGINMGDGWETRRSRRKNNSEWIVIKLGRCGVVKDIEVDTNHFKGNYPDEITILGFNEGGEWKELLPRVKLHAHTQQFFEKEVKDIGPITHIRAIIFPDGGVSRLRLNGIISNLQDIKSNPDAKTVIKAPPLVQSNFHHYGHVIEITEEIATGRDKRISLGAALTTTREGSIPQISVVRLTSTKLPFPLKRLEKQLYGSILFSPLNNNSRYLVICALSSKIGNRPDLFNLSVSVASPGQSIQVSYGIWYCIVPIDGEYGDFLVASYDTSPSDVSVYSVVKYGIVIDV